MADLPFIDECRTALGEAWEKICVLAQAGAIAEFLDDEGLVKRIQSSINCKTKTYRYVLPTQLVAKVVNRDLDCRCIQAARGGPGAFDARTVAHQVVVPFDRANEGVLGASAEPYVNNPLRIPEISKKYQKAQKDRKGWLDLCEVLDVVERRANSNFTLTVFHQILKEVYLRLAQVQVSYPVPLRISLERSLQLIHDFLAVRSGGDRFQAVTAAIFQSLGQAYGVFSEIRRGKITAADVAAGMLADMECVDDRGEIVLVVEAKDRELTITQLQDKIPALREKKVAETFFVAARGMAADDEKRITELIAQEFVSGQNIYVTELLPLARTVLALIGEEGRRSFLESVGHQLDLYSDLDHRRQWSALLAEI